MLPLVLGAWLGSGLSVDEHLKRLLRTRVFVLSMIIRGLMLLNLVAVLTIIGLYATELRGYPRITAGWLMVPTGGHDGVLDVVDYLVFIAAASVITGWPWARGDGGLRVVAVISGQLYSEGARGVDPGLLGSIPLG